MRSRTVSWLVAISLTVSVGAMANPEMRTNIKSIEFGYVGVDYNLYQIVELHNTGSSDLVITDVSPSCDCSQTWVADTILPPGGKTTVRLKFNTKNWFGSTDQNISIESNDPELPIVQIPYHSHVGQWVKGVRPNPRALFFLPGKTQGGIEIANTEFDEMELEIFDLADPWFRVEPAQKQADKGEKLLVKVIADDSLAPGTYESSFKLKITASDQDEPIILSIPVKLVKY